jgi:hypothetical protein
MPDIFITLRLELFPMHASDHFDEKEISWKSESNVILCFLLKAFFLINIFGVMHYENSLHKDHEHLSLRSESTKIFTSLKLFSK